VSKLSAAAWASADVPIDGLAAMDDHQAYRAARSPHPRRWLRQSPTGRLSINRAKNKQEERLEGKYPIATFDEVVPAIVDFQAAVPHLSPAMG
jgi:hypothetical protein